MKIAYTLLHYNNTAVTREAVRWLLEQKRADEIEIIIVDNASPNNSGVALRQDYAGQAHIHVLLNSENVGFAKGNNLGYRFARDELHCDTVVVMNNDVFIKDSCFTEKLADAVSENDADILAPVIQGRDGNQNPLRFAPVGNKKVLKLLVYNAALSVAYRIPGIRTSVASYLNRRVKTRAGTKCNTSGRIVPHGACVIYTPSWVQKEECAFLPCTFMYFEEDILAEYCQQKDYKIVYRAELEVHHVEDASVDYSKSSSVDKRKFIATNMTKSIWQLVKMRAGKGR